MPADSNNPSTLVVAVMCAAWCRACTEFRPAMDRLATQRPRMHFTWIDVEDDEELCGDLDIVDFPTLAVFRDGVPLHFGPSLPLENVVGRLVDELATRTPDAAADWPPSLLALGAAMRGRASGAPG